MNKDSHNIEFHQTLADKRTRFSHHLLDAIIFFVIFLVYVFSMEKFFGVMKEGDYLRPLGGLTLYLLYYVGFEYAFSKTPGKYYSYTKVVNKDGNKPTFLSLLIRNLFRLVPLDDISYLFEKRGWHDQISGTYVINEKHVTTKNKTH